MAANGTSRRRRPGGLRRGLAAGAVVVVTGAVIGPWVNGAVRRRQRSAEARRERLTPAEQPDASAAAPVAVAIDASNAGRLVFTGVEYGAIHDPSVAGVSASGRFALISIDGIAAAVVDLRSGTRSALVHLGDYSLRLTPGWVSDDGARAAWVSGGVAHVIDHGRLRLDDCKGVDAEVFSFDPAAQVLYAAEDDSGDWRGCAVDLARGRVRVRRTADSARGLRFPIDLPARRSATFGRGDLAALPQEFDVAPAPDGGSAAPQDGIVAVVVRRRTALARFIDGRIAVAVDAVDPAAATTESDAVDPNAAVDPVDAVGGAARPVLSPDARWTTLAVGADAFVRAALSADGRRAIVYGSIYDTASGRRLAAVHGAESALGTRLFDGNRIVDMRTGRVTGELFPLEVREAVAPHARHVGSQCRIPADRAVLHCDGARAGELALASRDVEVGVSAAGDRVVVREPAGYTVRAFPAGTLVAVLPSDLDALPRFLPGGTLLAGSTVDDHILVADASSGRAVRRFEVPRGYSPSVIGVHPTEALVAVKLFPYGDGPKRVEGLEQAVTVLDTVSGQSGGLVRPSGRAAAWSRDGKELAVIDENSLRRYDAASLRTLSVEQRGEMELEAANYMDDLRADLTGTDPKGFVAVARGHSTGDGAAFTITVRGSSVEYEITDPEELFVDIGSTMLVRSAGAARRLRGVSGRVVAAPAQQTGGAAADPSGASLPASASRLAFVQGGRLHLFDTHTGADVVAAAVSTTESGDQEISAFAFRPNGHIVAVTAEALVEYDLDGARVRSTPLVRRTARLRASVTPAFSHSATLVAVPGYGGTDLYDTGDGRLLATLTTPSWQLPADSVSWAADDKALRLRRTSVVTLHRVASAPAFR